MKVFTLVDRATRELEADKDASAADALMGALAKLPPEPKPGKAEEGCDLGC